MRVLAAGVLLGAILGLAIADAADRGAWFAVGVLVVMCAAVVGVVIDVERRSRRG